jgi:hypothetical protein
MAGNLGTLAVYLTARTESFNNKLDAAMRKISSFATLTPMKVAAAGAAFGAFAAKSITAFAESEQVVNKFNATLRANHESILRYSKPLQQLAGDLQNVTMFDDEAILSTMSLGINMGISADKMDETIKAAIGLTSRGMSLESAMMAIGKAANGNFKQLSMLGIQIDKNLTPQQKLNKLLEIGGGMFGIVTRESDSLLGRWTQMQNAIGNLWESFGSFFNELIDFKGIMSSITQSLNDFGTYISDHAFEWAYMIKSLSIEVEYAFKQVWNLISPLFQYAIDSTMALVQVVTAAGNNIANVFSWIYDNFTNLFSGMLDIAKAVVFDIGDLFKNLGVQIWNTLTLKDTDWTGLVANVGKNLDKTLSDLKITSLELDTSGVDAYVQTYKNLAANIAGIPDSISKTEDERIAAQDALFNRERDRKLSEINDQTDDDQDDDSPKKTGKVEFKLSSAMERGSVEAYSAIAKSGNKAQDEIAKNTAKSVVVQEKMVAKLDSIGGLKVATI